MSNDPRNANREPAKRHRRDATPPHGPNARPEHWRQENQPDWGDDETIAGEESPTVIARGGETGEDEDLPEESGIEGTSGNATRTPREGR